MFCLRAPTDSAWAQNAARDLDSVLVDHAHCEMKAATNALSLVVRHPADLELVRSLTAIAQEELEHFARVYALMEARGLALRPDTKDRYVNPMLERLRHGRNERFLDRMLLASVVEARAAERFGLLGEALEDPELSPMYRGFASGEEGHAELYPALAAKYFGADEIRERLDELARLEAEVVSALSPRATLY